MTAGRLKRPASFLCRGAAGLRLPWSDPPNGLREPATGACTRWGHRLNVCAPSQTAIRTADLAQAAEGAEADHRAASGFELAQRIPLVLEVDGGQGRPGLHRRYGGQNAVVCSVERPDGFDHGDVVDGDEDHRVRATTRSLPELNRPLALRYFRSAKGSCGNTSE